MCPKIVDKVFKSQQIAQAALTLFSEKGYSGTSVQDIAASLGFGKGTIYKYFKSKEDMFLASMKEWVSASEVELSRLLEKESDPIQKLYLFIDLNLMLLEPDNQTQIKQFFEVARQTFMEDGVLYNRPDFFIDMHLQIQQQLSKIFLDGISKGIFKPETAKDLDKIGHNILAYIDGIGLHCLFVKNSCNMKEQTDYFVHNLLQAITADKYQSQIQRKEADKLSHDKSDNLEKV
jgi:AcrR family transcriptional regulator